MLTYLFAFVFDLNKMYAHYLKLLYGSGYIKIQYALTFLT